MKDLFELIGLLFILGIVIGLVCLFYYIFGSFFSGLCGVPLWVGIIIAIILFSNSK